MKTLAQSGHPLGEFSPGVDISIPRSIHNQPTSAEQPHNSNIHWDQRVILAFAASTFTWRENLGQSTMPSTDRTSWMASSTSHLDCIREFRKSSNQINAIPSAVLTAAFTAPSAALMAFSTVNSPSP